ncbi:hypothetical protein ACHAQA_004738 [Verticillium albo-atrum]
MVVMALFSRPLRQLAFFAFALSTVHATSIGKRADSTECKLPADQNAHYSEGHNYRFGCAPSTGTIRAKMIFVDFPDQSDDGLPPRLNETEIPALQEWYKKSSFGSLSLDIDFDGSQFYRMPRPATSYNFVRNLTFEGHMAYIDDALDVWLKAMNISVPKVNSTEGALTDVLSRYIVPTPKASAITFSTAASVSIYTPGANLIAHKGITLSYDDLLYWGYKLLVHETGHTMCLPDLYPVPDGYIQEYVGNWDLMANTGAHSGDFFAWNKWKLGWLYDSEIDCITDAGSTTHTLSPVEVLSGGARAKAVVVKHNSTSVLVAEVRSNLGNNEDACSKGVLLYTVATNVATGNGPIRVVDSNPGLYFGLCAGDQLDDAPLTLNKTSSYTVEDWGVTVTVLEKIGEDYTIRVDVA